MTLHNWINFNLTDEIDNTGCLDSNCDFSLWLYKLKSLKKWNYLAIFLIQRHEKIISVWYFLYPNNTFSIRTEFLYEWQDFLCHFVGKSNILLNKLIKIFDSITCLNNDFYRWADFLMTTYHENMTIFSVWKSFLVLNSIWKITVWVKTPCIENGNHL